MTTLGQKIRALRLGWSFANRRECWVRICDAPGGFDIHLHPAGMPPAKSGKHEYRDLRGVNVDELLDMDDRLKSVTRVSKPATIFIAEGA